MIISGTVSGSVTYCDHEIEYTVIVNGECTDLNTGDIIFEGIEEVFISDMEGWCEWYDKHSDEVDKLIREDVDKKGWDDCQWDYSSGTVPRGWEERDDD